MNILVVYGTYSGGTQLVGEMITKTLSELGHAVTLQNVFETSPNDLLIPDALILGSNSWWELKEEGQMNSGYHKLKSRLAPGALKNKPCAVYALGDSHLYNVTFTKAADHLSALVSEFGGHVVGEALRIDRYYFDKVGHEPRIKQWAKEVDQSLKPEQNR